MEVRIYQHEGAVKGLLQAKRESPYILLINESVPTAILFLLGAAHCTPKESPADVFLAFEAAVLFSYSVQKVEAEIRVKRVIHSS